MEDLVRIGIADAAEQARIGQGAFERVARASGTPETAPARPPAVQRRPGSARSTPGRPLTNWSEARFFEPASVNSNVPCLELERCQNHPRGHPRVSDAVPASEAGRQSSDARRGTVRLSTVEDVVEEGERGEGGERHDDALADAEDRLTVRPLMASRGGLTERSTKG